MGKSMNPIDQHRRSQRKKELQKNKQKRLNARNEKVAATQTVKSVQYEISGLERKKKFHEGHLDAKDTKKLERLRKELKIVTEAEEVRKQQAEELRKKQYEDELKRRRSREGVAEINEEKFGAHAKKSVYYHEIMNPFGAPPPGKPMMYWKKGGGTTMNVDEAVMKSEQEDTSKDETTTTTTSVTANEEEDKKPIGSKEENKDSIINAKDLPKKLPPTIPPNNQQLTPPPPPPPRPPQQPIHQQFTPHNIPPPPPPPPPPTSSIPPPPPPPPLPLQPPSSIPIKSDLPPPLPPPSKAVQRANKKSNKRSLMSDIWASQEEIQCDNGSNALEGIPDPTDVKRRKRRKNDEVNQALELDPMCPSADGYGEYRNQDQIKRSTVNSKKKKKKKKKKDAVESTSVMWFYQDTSGNLQGPFQPKDMIGWQQAGFFPPDLMVRNGGSGPFVPISAVDLQSGKELNSNVAGSDAGLNDVDSRIAALRQEREQEEQRLESDVDARIAALRKEKDQEEQVLESDVDSRIAALRNEREQDDSVDARIAALRGDSAKVDDAQHPQPSETDEGVMTPYPIAESQDATVPYPTEGDTITEEAYPSDDVDSRIAPLRNEREQEDGVDARIAALRGNSAGGDNDAQRPQPSATDEGVMAPYPTAESQDATVPYPTEGDGNTEMAYPAYPSDDVDSRIAALRKDREQDDSIDARIAALRGDSAGGDNDAQRPQPSATDEGVMTTYPTADSQHEAVTTSYPSEPPTMNDVAASPAVDEMEEQGVAAYPQVEDDGDVPYPTDIAYPVEEGDVPYPTDLAYPLDDDYVAAYPPPPDMNDTNNHVPMNASYPEVEPYPHIAAPSIEQSPAEVMVPKKKVYDGDKSILAMVPRTSRVQPTGSKKKRKVGAS